MMKKLDFKKTLKPFYAASTSRVEIVDVPPMHFLMIDGQGNPGTSQAFSEAVEALYPLAYTLKFMVRNSDAGIDFGVMPLQGLWWADNMDAFVTGNKDDWLWTLMIMQPDLITAAMVEQAFDQVRVKKNPPALSKVRYEPYEEGPAAQIMHIGPFSEEGPNILKIHDFIHDQGRALRGKHHEIYLSDMRRTAPERLRTIIRQPMT